MLLAAPKLDSTAPTRVANVLRVTLEFIKSSGIDLLPEFTGVLCTRSLKNVRT
jgi:hypothetical protein